MGRVSVVGISEQRIFRLPVVFRYTSVVKTASHPDTPESSRGPIVGGIDG